MTNEEFERVKNSIRANLASEPDPEAEKARRKLDRDMDRIERVLKKMVEAPWRPPTPTEADRRLTKALAELSQKRSKHSIADKRLDALNDIVRPDREGPSS